MISPISPLTCRQRYADHFSDIISELLEEGENDAVMDMVAGFNDALNAWDKYLVESKGKVDTFRTALKQSL